MTEDNGDGRGDQHRAQREAERLRREARLAQALRANLRRRKAQNGAPSPDRARPGLAGAEDHDD